MGRYAKRLSAVGFALVVWHIYSLGRSLWIEWAFEQRHGLGEFPHPLTLALGLVSIVLTIGVVVLLRRLAAPGPKGAAVRWLARLWFALGVCTTGWFAFAIWLLGNETQYSPSIYFSTVASAIHIAVALAYMVFVLATLPPLWVLSRPSPATR